MHTQQAVALKPHVIKDSFAALAPLGPVLVERFYELLFDEYPETQALFAETDMARQQKTLLAGLVRVVSLVEEPDELVSYLRALGTRHVQYGAAEAHYPIVAQVMLETLEEIAGPDWSRELHQQWSAALDLIGQTMIEGAREVSVQEPEAEAEVAAPPVAPVAPVTPVVLPAPVSVTLPADIHDQIRQAVHEAFRAAVDQAVAQAVEDEARAFRERGFRLAG